MKPAVLVLLAVVACGALVFASSAMASTGEDAPEGTPSNTGPEDAQAAADTTFWDLYAGTLEQANPYTFIMNSSVSSAADDTQVKAFQAVIGYSEGTDKEPDAYRVCYGYRHVIQSFADHPAITGEWRGEDISAIGTRYVGMVSTAAGRYQINKPTWLDCKRALGLTDFTPDSQDRAMVYLVDKRGKALQAIQAGQLDKAVELCAKAKLWASFPGDGAGQGERKLSSLRVAFTDNGGALA